MRKQLYHTVIIVLLVGGCLLSGGVGHAQKDDPKKTYLLFVLDGSVSMGTRWQTTNRINVARQALKETILGLDKQNLKMGLRVFGHTSPEKLHNCKDTRLEVPFETNNGKKIIQEVGGVTPRGTTPLTYALEKAADDFPHHKNTRNVIILITDGREACDKDPCSVSLKFQRKNVFLKPFVIGMSLPKGARGELDCIGEFTNARTQKTFKSTLKRAFKRSLGTASTQIHLLDNNQRPTEKNVNVTFYDHFSGGVEHNYYQTFNAQGLPDTFYLDPVKNYDVTVHTIPSRQKKNVSIKPQKHNVISFNTPQGQLEVKMEGKTIENNVHGKIRCLLRKKHSNRILHVQEINKKERYLVGKYDLEVLTLPRIEMDNITISQNHTTSITIPTPGLVNIVCKYPGYGGVYVKKKKNLRKIYRINTTTERAVLALQPGKYKIIFRAKLSNNTKATIEKSFNIKSGSSSTVKLK